MNGVWWFRFGEKWHALKLDSDRQAECGLAMQSAVKATESTDEDPYPPVPCMRCAVIVQDRFMVEEPLEDALARGFERMDSSDLE